MPTSNARTLPRIRKTFAMHGSMRMKKYQFVEFLTAGFATLCHIRPLHLMDVPECLCSLEK